MKITQEVRDYAAENGLTEEQKAIEAGFKEQAERFREEGSVIYKQV
jgi:phosphomethylpyrimidine synthase